MTLNPNHSSDLHQFLEHIAYHGALKLDVSLLKNVHRLFLQRIPYENFDIHLGCTLLLSEEASVRKIVLERRGGWCYEMNTLLCWALRELGFTAWYASAAINRAVRGDLANGNHLVVIVQLEGDLWLCDAGFGNGLVEPIPIQVGVFDSAWMQVRLERQGDVWFFHADPRFGGGSFDFRLEPKALSDFQERCTWLQTSSDSGFVKSTVCMRHDDQGILALRGAVLSEIRVDGEQQRTLSDAAAFVDVLRTYFRLEFPEAEQLWPAIWERHLHWLAEAKDR
jgi:N-hydroxyarylamine O-acetyltransferase